LENPANNPYAYEIDEFKEVDPSLIKYREIKRIALRIEKPKAISYKYGMIAIAYDKHIQIIDTSGVEQFIKSTTGPNTCIAISPAHTLFVGCTDHIELFDMEGNLLQKWDTISHKAYVTSIAFKDNHVFVANAGDQLVSRFSTDGELLSSFDGKVRLEGSYGFIIPSPYFDLAVDSNNELWVVNPGLHYIENYTDEGTLRAYWGKTSFGIEGFTGCCNPAHFTILPDDSFVTSEKGLVRIKVHKPSGELDCVVAGPNAFDKKAEPADITADENGRIYALDITKKIIRIFERNAV
jgi:hypothetical protein